MPKAKRQKTHKTMTQAEHDRRWGSRVIGDKAGKAKWDKIIKYWLTAKRHAKDRWSWNQANNALKKAKAMRKKYV